MKRKVLAVFLTAFLTVFPFSHISEAKADVNVRKVSTCTFVDITNHWSRHYVERLQNMSIVIGDGRYFRPDDSVTRAEALAMMMRIDGHADIKAKMSFSDVSENDWFYSVVSRAKNAEIITDGTQFFPYETITRYQMAEWTVKFMRYIGYDIPDGEDYPEICKNNGIIYDLNDGPLTRGAMVAVINRIIDFEERYSFYVDYENGNDTNCGSLEKPFKSVEAAKETVRALSEKMDKDIYVYLKSGYFKLEEPIVFSEKDSGKNGYSIIYSSYGDGNCMLSGGEIITGWKLYDEEMNIYRAVVEKGTESRQLFVNGIRATRARSDGGLTDCTYDNGEMGHTTTDLFLADYKRPEDLEFVYNSQWVQNRIGVKKIEESKGIVNIYMDEGWKTFRSSGNAGGLTPAYYENAYELISEDGEFYLDSVDGYLYYRPRKNEDLKTAEVILPVIEKLLTVQGTLDNFVKNISFVNIDFAYTTWFYVNDPHGLITVQNNILNPSEVNDQSYPTGAVNVYAADGITFEKCKFKSLGINGLNMLAAINNCAVAGCEFGDISGAGMCFGDVANKAKNPIDRRIMLNNNEITNNYFHDTPCEYFAASTLTIGFPTNAYIAHNEFFNTPYSAIHAAIGWGVLLESVFDDITFENNYFHEINTSELYDSGAIYTLGGTGGDDSDPLIIKGNYIKNKYRVGGAFYPDEGSSNYYITENVIDLRDVKSVDEHRKGDKASWLFNNPAYSGNIIADKNYVTSDVAMTRTNVLATNTYAYPDADWCPEALEIIENSGITDEYKYLFPDELQMYKTNMPEISYTDVGKEFQIELYDTTKRKELSENISSYPIIYSSDNKEVATVSDDGKVKFNSDGIAKVSVSVIADDVEKKHSTTFYVGDKASDAIIKKNFYKLEIDETGTFDITVKKKYSKEIVKYDSIEYKTEDENVAYVDKDGIVHAKNVGKTDVVFTIMADGNKIEAETEIEVQRDIPEITQTVNLSDMIAVADNWYYDENASIVKADNSLSLGTYGNDVGTAFMKDKTYTNELLNFDMSFDFSGSSWPSLILRAQNMTNCIGSKNTSYLIVFKSDVIEVQRFSQGGRFVFCGDVNGFIPKVNYGIENKYIENSKRYNIKVGAIDVEDGVRIVCYANGKKIVDVIDDTQGAITNGGYFGVCDKVNKTTFYGDISDEK